MIRGTVDDRLQASIDLDVAGPTRARRIEAVIDTGFNGFLSLEAGAIRDLELKSMCLSEGTLADGTVTDFETYLATTIWQGVDRIISVIESAGGNLLGMELLKGSRLVIDVVERGPVTIQLLSDKEASNETRSG